MPLSVVIHTKNAAQTLMKTLESVVFADEIVVIDMHSTDDTLKIAQQFTERIFQHEDVGYADPARNFGLSQARHEWILVVDADEEVSPGLRNYVEKIVAGTGDPAMEAAAYYLPRKNMIFNHWIQHTGWWPDYQLRLFKKGQVSWHDGVHQLAETKDQPARELPAEEKLALIHHNYQTVSDFIDRLNRYTTIKAAENKRQKTLTLSEADLIATFGNEFLSRFFARQGIADGSHGLSLSLLQAMYEVVVKLKEWQATGFPAETDPAVAVGALRQFQGDLNYWLADWQIKYGPAWQKWWWQLRRKYRF